MSGLSMAVTMQDIADKAGVNIATVSVILNNRPLAKTFMPETRQRVRDVAKELNYRPSFLGRSLAKGKTSTLAMFCGGINRPHFAELAETALQEARRRKHQLLISVTEWNQQEEEDCLRMLMGRQVDGILMQLDCIRQESELYRQILEMRFPVVTLNARQDIEGIMSVQSDFLSGTREAVACLARQGHRAVHMLGSAVVSPVSDPKISAFYTACQELGVEPSVSLSQSDPASAEKAGMRIAEEGHKAVIVFCDYVSISVMRGMHRAGLSVPDDVDLIGTCGTDWAAMYLPSLASIAIDRRRLVSLGMDLLFEKIADRDIQTRHLVIPTALRTGRSVKGLPDPAIS